MKLRKFTVDISKGHSSEKGWSEVINNKQFINKVQRLSKVIDNEFLRFFDKKYRAMIGCLGTIIANFKFIFNIKAKYRKEINIISKHSKSGKGIFFGNLSYEAGKLSQDAFSANNLDWCSSISINTNNGPIHSRNLDWTMSPLKNNVVEIKFIGATAGDFTSITFPGFIGVLTGIAPGRFSASINAMTEDYGYDFRKTPVSFILREAFEECRNFKEAVKFLKNSEVFCPAFIHLVGVKNNEQCIIVITPDRRNNFVIKSKNGKTCITNHIPYSKDPDDDSEKRLKYANTHLTSRNIRNINQGFRLMRKSPLLNSETKYTVSMNAANGKYVLKG